MHNRASHFDQTGAVAAASPDGGPLGRLAQAGPIALPVADVAKLGRSWLLDGELSDRSPKTLKTRRDTLAKLQWFLARRECAECGLDELRGFFLYLQRGHLEPGGRWGNPTETQPLRPLSLRTYYAYLRAFFNWCAAEGRLPASPMERVPAPKDPGDEVQPFADEEVARLLRAAGQTRQGERDRAIVLVLLDTGLRAQELCDLQYRDLDLDARSLKVRAGKGNKSRTVYLGRRATKALFDYVQADGRERGDPLFFAQSREGLTYAGLRQLFRRLGLAATVKDCHAHRMRHSFAISFLRAGGQQLALMRLLGHTTLTMTNRYVQWATGDMQAQHRQASPADRLGRRGAER